MKNENLVLIAQFCLHHQVEPAFMMSLHELDLIKIAEVDAEQYLYIDQLHEVEKIIRLHHELGINLEGIAAVNTLLKQVEMLQQELLVAKNRLMMYDSQLQDNDNNHHNH